MLIDPKTGRKIVTGEEAAAIFHADASYIRKLFQRGELSRLEESPRRVYYFLDEVERLNRTKAEIRKKRGGRPRKGEQAA
jgi:hypothetical protein